MKKELKQIIDMNKKPKKDNQAEIIGDKVNVDATKNDAETWKIVRKLLKTLKKGDELGFCIERAHYIIRKGNFSKKIILE